MFRNVLPFGRIKEMPVQILSSYTSTRLRRLLWLILVALPILVFVWNSLYFTPWTVDDAFISFRFAQNLIDGNGLVYNLGERVEGFSNFSWVLIAAALMRFEMPFITMLKVIGLAAGVSILLLGSSLAFRLGGQSNGRLCAILALWYLGFNTSLALWCQSGLETTLFAALIAAMVLRFEIEVGSTRKVPWSAVLFALAWMTRPEAPIFALYFLVRRLTVPRPPDRKDLWWIVAFAALVVPYEVWGYTYYGGLLPQAHAVKVGNTWGWSRLTALDRYLTAQGWGFAGLLALGLAGAIRRRGLPPAVWVPLLSGLIFVVYAGGDWMPRYRPFVSILAFQGCFVALGIVALIQITRHRRILFAMATGAALLAGADYAREQLIGAYPFGGASRFPREARSWSWWEDVPKNLRLRKWPLPTTTLTILGHTDRDDRIGIKDFGFPGFVTMNPIWDHLGLVTPSAEQLQRGREDAQVRDRSVREFLATGGATHIFVFGDTISPPIALEQLLKTHPDLQARYRQVDAGQMSDPDPTHLERIVLCLPRGSNRIWRLRELPVPTANEVLANLERRLPEVVARFPEFGPSASKILAGVRRKVQEEGSSHLEDDTN
jgi:hypothetical protein